MHSAWMLGEGVQALEANTTAYAFGILTSMCTANIHALSHSEKGYFGKIQKSLLQLLKVEVFDQ